MRGECLIDELLRHWGRVREGWVHFLGLNLAHSCDC
jgi:hypothetical protein